MSWEVQTQDILTKEPKEDVRSSEEPSQEDPYFQTNSEETLPKARAQKVITHYISVEFKIEGDEYPISEEMLRKLAEHGASIPDRIVEEDDDL